MDVYIIITGILTVILIYRTVKRIKRREELLIAENMLELYLANFTIFEPVLMENLDAGQILVRVFEDEEIPQRIIDDANFKLHLNFGLKEYLTFSNCRELRRGFIIVAEIISTYRTYIEEEYEVELAEFSQFNRIATTIRRGCLAMGESTVVSDEDIMKVFKKK